MASGTIDLGTSGYLQCRITWSSTSNGTAQNSSQVTGTLQARRTNSSTTTGTWTGTLTLGNTPKSYSVYAGITSSWVTLCSFTITQDHASDGKGACSIYGQIKGPSGTTMSGITLSKTQTVTLDTIPRAATITSAPDFNDEQNPTISYSNPAGNAVTALDACISFTGAKADIAYRAVDKTGSSYTFNLTDAERKTLRQWVTAGSNSREIIFYLKTNIGGTEYHSTVKKTLTIINDIPTLSPTVKVTDNLTKELTGDINNTIIKGISVVDYNINAAAYKEAHINGQWVLNNDITKYEPTGTFTNLQSGYFLFAASDTRGRHIRAEKILNVVNYIPLTCDFDHEISFVENSENKINIAIIIKGNCFNGTFGAVSNELRLAYRYKVNNGSWSDLINPITETSRPEFNADTYSFTTKLLNVDYQDVYTVQCVAFDKINDVEPIWSKEYAIKAQPVFDWGKDDFNFNVPISIQGKSVEDFITEEGTVNGWNYRQWNRGIVECWTTINLNTAVATAYGNGFYNGTTLSVNFPPGAFLAKPYTYMSVEPSNAQIYSINIGALSKNDLAYYISSMKSQTAASLQVNIYAFGFWK